MEIINIVTDVLEKNGVYVLIKDNIDNIIYPNNIPDLFLNCEYQNEIYDFNTNKTYQIIKEEKLINNNLYTIYFIKDISLLNYYKQECMIDHITGIYNTRTIMKKLEETIIEQKSNNFSIAICDIDNFKEFNDKYSHITGDSVLRTVADILKETVSNGYVGRYGGDEFLLIFKNTDCKECQEKLDIAINKIKKIVIPFEEKQIDNISISCGICELDEIDKYTDNASILRDELFICADKALYESKNHGKGIVKIYKKK